MKYQLKINPTTMMAKILRPYLDFSLNSFQIFFNKPPHTSKDTLWRQWGALLVTFDI